MYKDAIATSKNRHLMAVGFWVVGFCFIKFQLSGERNLAMHLEYPV